MMLQKNIWSVMLRKKLRTQRTKISRLLDLKKTMRVHNLLMQMRMGNLMLSTQRKRTIIQGTRKVMIGQTLALLLMKTGKLIERL